MFRPRVFESCVLEVSLPTCVCILFFFFANSLSKETGNDHTNWLILGKRAAIAHAVGSLVNVSN